MFDLEMTITDWKAGFDKVDSMTEENLQELEEHLRETVAALQHKGLDEQEAFWVAAKRLGHPIALGDEYYKVNGAQVWQKRVLWILGGYVGGVAFSSLISGVGALGASLASFVGLGGAPAGATTVAILVAGWAVLLGGIYLRASIKHSGASSDRVPLAWCIGLVAMILIGRGMGFLGTVIQMRTSGASAMGEWARWSSFGGLAVQGFVLLVCVAMMLVFSQSASDRTHLAS